MFKKFTMYFSNMLTATFGVSHPLLTWLAAAFWETIVTYPLVTVLLTTLGSFVTAYDLLWAMIQHSKHWDEKSCIVLTYFMASQLLCVWTALQSHAYICLRIENVSSCTMHPCLHDAFQLQETLVHCSYALYTIHTFQPPTVSFLLLICATWLKPSEGTWIPSSHFFSSLILTTKCGCKS